jgi:hypothetical protein
MVFTGVMAPPKLRPARFSLFSAADVINHGEGDEHWLSGFDYETESCNFEATLHDMCQPGVGEKIFERDADIPNFFEAEPFSIEAIDRCSTFGFASVDRRARVLRQLELVTPKAVERELWSGAFASTLNAAVAGDNKNRFLASTDAEDLTPGGGAVPVKVGLALLEGAMGDCGPGVEGVIHLTRRAASMASASGAYRQVPEDPKRLETMLGTTVSAGSGYPGAGPGNVAAAANTAWMYATGPVTVHLGPKQLINAKSAQAVDIHVNDLIYQAERPASVVWDGCCHFAVLVDLMLA